MATTEVTIGTGRLEVTLRVEPLGRDLLAVLGGGDVHVGAVAVAGPRAGTAGEHIEALVVSPGHKEGPLATRVARDLAEATGRTCTAVAGIHIDHATPDEIAALVANAHEALRLAAKGLVDADSDP